MTRNECVTMISQQLDPHSDIRVRFYRAMTIAQSLKNWTEHDQFMFSILSVHATATTTEQTKICEQLQHLIKICRYLSNSPPPSPVEWTVLGDEWGLLTLWQTVRSFHCPATLH